MMHQPCARLANGSFTLELAVIELSYNWSRCTQTHLSAINRKKEQETLEKKEIKISGNENLEKLIFIDRKGFLYKVEEGTEDRVQLS